jgi:hypothetical protein
MRKDLGLALDEGRGLGLSFPVAALIDQLYADIQSMGGGRQDTSAILRRLPKRGFDDSEICRRAARGVAVWRRGVAGRFFGYGRHSGGPCCGLTLNSLGNVERFNGIVIDREGRVIQLLREGDPRPAKLDFAADGHGAVLLPGLIDAHAHVMGVGIARSRSTCPTRHLWRRRRRKSPPMPPNSRPSVDHRAWMESGNVETGPFSDGGGTGRGCGRSSGLAGTG